MARFDEAYARTNNDTKHLQSAQNNITKYKQSLLKATFSGTLTATPSLREVGTISWQSTKPCHTDRSEISQSKNNRDTSLSAKVQYDKNNINHFIPFSEVEVGAKQSFKSDFMVRFINGKCATSSLRTNEASVAIHDKDLQIDCQEVAPTSHNDKKLFELESTQYFIPTKPLDFSPQAHAVFKAGLELWRYYHAQATSKKNYINDASLYDIKEYFQGRGESKNGKSNARINARSEDSHYNDLLANLRLELKNLAQKIEPKIYEYEFLQE